MENLYVIQNPPYARKGEEAFVCYVPTYGYVAGNNKADAVRGTLEEMERLKKELENKWKFLEIFPL